MYNNNPITQLPPIVSIAPDDVLPIVDISDIYPIGQSPSGTTKKVTMIQILDYVQTANPWIIVTSNPTTLVPNQGYITDTIVVALLTLPLTAAVGDQYYIEGLGPNLFEIHQNAGQSIVFDSATTTVGTSGYIQSTNPGDGLTIMCTVANTTFKVRSSIGTFITI